MEWRISQGLTDYTAALATMQSRVEAVQRGEAEELVWLLQHPPLYTAGSSARAQDLLQAQGLPVFETGRGGQYTYHGPGQRVVYLVLDLNRRGRDLRKYVQQLEQWIIDTLAQFDVRGFTREGRVGVWVEESGVKCQVSGVRGQDSRWRSLEPETQNLKPEKKIAALGVRCQKWVVSHGIAINVNPDLAHYAGIVPCGIREFGVTSLQAMGKDVSMDAVDAALRETAKF